MLQHRLQPANPRLQLPDGVPHSELAAAANADVPGYQHHRLHADRSTNSELSLYPQHPSGSRSPREPLFLAASSVNQGDAGRVRGLKFAFAAGVVQGEAAFCEQRSENTPLKSAGDTTPPIGSA